MDTAKKFVLAIMVIAVIAFTLLILVQNLTTTSDTLASRIQAARTTNQSTTLNVTDASYTSLTGYDKYGVSCTLIEVVGNATGTHGTVLGNYTYDSTGCRFKFNGTETGAYNLTQWNISYDYSYLPTESIDVARNLSIGQNDFFKNASTWFTMLSVMIIILIIAVVIIVVSRFGAGGGGGMRSESDGTDL